MIKLVEEKSYEDQMNFYRQTLNIKEDSFDDIGFDYKTRYISNFQQDALYELIDYLVALGAISGPEDKRIDIIEEPQLDSVQLKLLSDFPTYKKVLDWIKRNNAYVYESNKTRRIGKRLHEKEDVEIEVKHKREMDEEYVDGKYYDFHTLVLHWRENLTNYGRKQLYSTYNPLDFDAWVSSMLNRGYTKLDIMSFLLCVEEKSINDIKNCMSSWLNEGVEIEVKHEGILEVPEGKNVDDLPISHFEKLAKKKGLSKITRALNNLQVWNKNDNPKLSKWAGDMIDKLNKRMEKKESLKTESVFKSYWRYNLNDPNKIKVEENDDFDEYFDKYSIRKIKLTPCETPEDCYVDEGGWSTWAVCSDDYPYDEIYGTKEQAYDELMYYLNNSIYERRHDL